MWFYEGEAGDSTAVILKDWAYGDVELSSWYHLESCVQEGGSSFIYDSEQAWTRGGCCLLPLKILRAKKGAACVGWGFRDCSVVRALT